MTADLLQLLKRRCEDGAVALAPGAIEPMINDMQVASKRDLGTVIPDSFVEFLRFSNGIQIQGAYFKKVENLVSENVGIDCPEIIVLGNDGSMAWYVFDKRDTRYHTINLGFPDERFESYDSFEDMLIGVLQEQGVF